MFTKPGLKNERTTTGFSSDKEASEKNPQNISREVVRKVIEDLVKLEGSGPESTRAVVELEENIAKHGWKTVESAWLQETREFLKRHGIEDLTITPRQMQSLSELRGHMQDERKSIAKLLLWGPPGSGKTELARILAAVSARKNQEVMTMAWSSLSTSESELVSVSVSSGKTVEELLTEELKDCNEEDFIKVLSKYFMSNSKLNPKQAIKSQTLSLLGSIGLASKTIKELAEENTFKDILLQYKDKIISHYTTLARQEKIDSQNGTRQLTPLAKLIERGGIVIIDEVDPKSQDGAGSTHLSFGQGIEGVLDNKTGKITISGRSITIHSETKFIMTANYPGNIPDHLRGRTTLIKEKTELADVVWLIRDILTNQEDDLLINQKQETALVKLLSIWPLFNDQEHLRLGMSFAAALATRLKQGMNLTEAVAASLGGEGSSAYNMFWEQVRKLRVSFTRSEDLNLDSLLSGSENVNSTNLSLQALNWKLNRQYLKPKRESVTSLKSEPLVQDNDPFPIEREVTPDSVRVLTRVDGTEVILHEQVNKRREDYDKTSVSPDGLLIVSFSNNDLIISHADEREKRIYEQINGRILQVAWLDSHSIAILHKNSNVYQFTYMGIQSISHTEKNEDYPRKYAEAISKVVSRSSSPLELQEKVSDDIEQDELSLTTANNFVLVSAGAAQRLFRVSNEGIIERVNNNQNQQISLKPGQTGLPLFRIGEYHFAGAGDPS